MKKIQLAIAVILMASGSFYAVNAAGTRVKAPNCYYTGDFHQTCTVKQTWNDLIVQRCTSGSGECWYETDLQMDPGG